MSSEYTRRIAKERRREAASRYSLLSTRSITSTSSNSLGRFTIGAKLNVVMFICAVGFILVLVLGVVNISPRSRGGKFGTRNGTSPICSYIPKLCGDPKSESRVRSTKR